MTVQISAVLITFNEESNIADAIGSVKWADEILVVDSGSTDGTREIAADLGARVIERAWPGFSAQKQFAVDSASHDWVFSLDADERVSKELADSIESVRRSNASADGYSISRLPYYMGRPIRHGGWYPDPHVRLFDRRKGKWKDTIIHESVEMAAGTRVEKLSGELLHYTVRNVSEHHRMIGERYAPLSAEQMFAEGRRSNAINAASASAGAFLKSYILKRGFLDGYPGFCIAWFAAHNAFLKHSLLIEKYARESGSNETPAS